MRIMILLSVIKIKKITSGLDTEELLLLHKERLCGMAENFLEI